MNGRMYEKKWIKVSILSSCLFIFLLIKTASSQEASLEVNLLDPNPATCNESYPCNWIQHQTYWINATVECKGGDCGKVDGTARYNDTGDVMTAISTTEGATPFYITYPLSIELDQETPYGENVVVFGNTAQTSQSFKSSYTGNLTNVSIYLKKRDIAGTPGDIILEIRTENVLKPDTPDMTGEALLGSVTIPAFTDTSYKWYMVNFLPEVEITSGVKYVILVKSPASSTFIYQWNMSDTNPYPDGARSYSLDSGESWSVSSNYDLTIRTYMKIAQNLQSCGNLNLGQSCQLNWTVDVTATPVRYRKIDVYFNSSQGIVNNTDDAIIRDILELPGYCDKTISTLHDTYTIDQDNTYYCLTNDLYIGEKTAIEFAPGVQDSTLDCLGYSIDGDETPATSGINLTKSITNDTIKNCIITDFGYAIVLKNGNDNNFLNNNVNDNQGHGFWLDSSSNNYLENNNACSNNIYGIWLEDSSNNNLVNNTVFENGQRGFELDSSFNNFITGGSISDNSVDYVLVDSGTSNYFTNTNFTDSRIIYFHDTISRFNYNNVTTGGIWLKTNVSASLVRITRELISWDQSLMQWSDSADPAVTAGYIITGLKENTEYRIYDNNDLVKTKETNEFGEINFTIYLSSEHVIKVREAIDFLIIDSIEVLPSSPVEPRDGDNVQMNVTVNVTTNSTTIDTCTIRIFNVAGDNLYLSMPDPGTIQGVDSQIQCFYEWDMEYWRNPGPWNVSVNLNLKDIPIRNFTSKNFTYTELPAIALFDKDYNLLGTYITFQGLPGATIPSDNADPMYVQNTGNVAVDVDVGGDEFKCDKCNAPNPTCTPEYPGISSDHIEIYRDESLWVPLDASGNPVRALNNVLPETGTPQYRSLFFRMNIPTGYLDQDYCNDINIQWNPLGD